MILADKIIEERKRNGWSQEELAEKVGTKQTTVSMWETNKNLPRAATMRLLASILGCTVDELLGNP